MLINEYCNFYSMELKSLIQYYYDNNEVVTKLRKITEKDRNYYSSSSKIKDLDAILEIQTCIPIKSVSKSENKVEKEDLNVLTIQST